MSSSRRELHRSSQRWCSMLQASSLERRILVAGSDMSVLWRSRRSVSSPATYFPCWCRRSEVISCSSLPGASYPYSPRHMCWHILLMFHLFSWSPVITGGIYVYIDVAQHHRYWCSGVGGTCQWDTYWYSLLSYITFYSTILLCCTINKWIPRYIVSYSAVYVVQMLLSQSNS